MAHVYRRRRPERTVLCGLVCGVPALSFFADYSYYLEIAGKLEVFSLSDPAVIIGGLVPYLFGAMAMEAAGRAAISPLIKIINIVALLPVPLL